MCGKGYGQLTRSRGHHDMQRLWRGGGNVICGQEGGMTSPSGHI